MNKLLLLVFCCSVSVLWGHEDPREQERRDRLARAQRVQDEELEQEQERRERAFHAGIIAPAPGVAGRLEPIEEEDEEGIDPGFFSDGEDEGDLVFVERPLPLVHTTFGGVLLPTDLSRTDLDIFYAILHNINQHYQQEVVAGSQERMAAESAWMEDLHEFHRLCGRRALPHEDRYISWLVRGGRIEMDMRQEGYDGCLCRQDYICTLCARGDGTIDDLSGVV